MAGTILTAGDVALMPLFSALKTEGVSLITTVTGRQCLDKLRDLTPDLIIIDETLFDARGSDIASRIKQVPRLRKVPLIMLLPQHDSDRLATEAALIGAEAVLVRPFSRKTLQATAAELLGDDRTAVPDSTSEPQTRPSR